MEFAARKAVLAPQRIAVLGTSDDPAGQRIAREVSRIARLESLVPVVTTTNLVHIQELSARFEPALIVLDDDFASSVPLQEVMRKLASAAHVVLIAPVERQGEIAGMVATGDIDFVARAGDFAPLAIGLVERQLRSAHSAAQEYPGPRSKRDLGEIFRHEINNPLTGILGNAEMLLSHRERLPIADVQRLQTVVDLAVRLRETTRRLSLAWESENRSPKSA